MWEVPLCRGKLRTKSVRRDNRWANIPQKEKPTHLKKEEREEGKKKKD